MGRKSSIGLLCTDPFVMAHLGQRGKIKQRKQKTESRKRKNLLKVYCLLTTKTNDVMLIN